MNVWVRMTKRTSKCFWCGKDIEVGEYQIICTYFMKVRSGKTWTKRMIFHASPNCWVERAIAEIESKPQIENRGRKPLQLNDELKDARNKVLRRRASVMQRLEKEMYGSMRPATLLHLTEQLEKLKVEVEPLGGVPKGW
jgi:hypothetical protein